MSTLGKKDRVGNWLFAGGLLIALFFGQGIPLWDDDFSTWFHQIGDRSVASIFLEWLSPVSTQPQYWGFNERPLQMLIYKVCYLVSGYDSWSYMLFKSFVYAGLGVMIYQWGLCVVSKTRGGRIACVLAAVFFLVAPGPIAAHIIHCDYAPLAELIFLGMTLLIWNGIEATPLEYRGVPNLFNPEHRHWLLRWLLLSTGVYLGYKAKADLKLIPAILAVHVLFVRPKQIGFFAFPTGVMLLLAIPWSGNIFHRLPPFVPGSGGSEIGWMWQPTSLHRTLEFFWSSQGYDLWTTLRAPTLSLAALFGPFLLGGLAVFFLWRLNGTGFAGWASLVTPEKRARFFIVIWFFAICAAISALPALNYPFRIRYGILPLVPLSILLAGAIDAFLASRPRLPRWAVAVAALLFAFQCGMNFMRSASFRCTMGRTMISIDQAYGWFARNCASDDLTLLPDFLAFNYRPDAPKSFLSKDALQSVDDLQKRHLPNRACVLSWSPSLSEQLELIQRFPGTSPSYVFDWIFPATSDSGAYLMRFIGPDPLFLKGEELRKKGDLAGARKAHDEFIALHPADFGGMFSAGLDASLQNDWPRTREMYGSLENYFPNQVSIVFNLGLAMENLKDYDGAIRRFNHVLELTPSNSYASLIHLYVNYKKSDRPAKAMETLIRLKQLFPNDPAVIKLAAENASP